MDLVSFVCFVVLMFFLARLLSPFVNSERFVLKLFGVGRENSVEYGHCQSGRADLNRDEEQSIHQLGSNQMQITHARAQHDRTQEFRERARKSVTTFYLFIYFYFTAGLSGK